MKNTSPLNEKKGIFGGHFGDTLGDNLRFLPVWASPENFRWRSGDTPFLHPFLRKVRSRKIKILRSRTFLVA